jgi:hypothetical protein
MSSEHSPVRQHSIAAYTVTEFCQSHRLSRAKLYALWSEGAGPRFFMVGAHRRISTEAAADWRAAGEAEAALATSTQEDAA